MCLVMFSSLCFVDMAELILKARLRGVWILSGRVCYSYKRVWIWIFERPKVLCPCSADQRTEWNINPSILILPNVSVSESLNSLMPVFSKSLCFLISLVSWVSTVSIQRYLLETGNLTEETAGQLRNTKWKAHSGKPKQNWKFRPFAKQAHAKNATEKGFGWLFCFLQCFKKCNTCVSCLNFL